MYCGYPDIYCYQQALAQQNAITPRQEDQNLVTGYGIFSSALRKEEDNTYSAILPIISNYVQLKNSQLELIFLDGNFDNTLVKATLNNVQTITNLSLGGVLTIQGATVTLPAQEVRQNQPVDFGIIYMSKKHLKYGEEPLKVLSIKTGLVGI